MKAAFIYPGHENLGLEYLSAFLKKNGHKTKLFFDPVLFNDHKNYNPILAEKLDFSEDIVNRLFKYQPDVVGFSVISTYYLWALKLARKIKQACEVPIVFGGIHPTSVPENVLLEPCVDFVVVGEGEAAFADLLKAIENKNKKFEIPNIWYKNDSCIVKNDVRCLQQNLDELPFPDKELFYNEVCFCDDYTIITGRGCPYSCSFCNSSLIKDIYKGKGNTVRKRSVGNVIEELTFALDRYNPKMVVFDDELLTYDKKWLDEFSREYKRRINKLSFCWVHPLNIDDDIITCLKRLNCYNVHMGIQTLNPRTRKKNLNRYYSNTEIVKAITLLQKSRIRSIVEYIVGLPGDTKEDYIDIIRFHSQHKVQAVNLYNLQCFPKTKIIEKMGLSKESIEKINNGLNFIPYEIFTSNNELSIYNDAVALLPAFPARWAVFLLEKKKYKLIKFLARFFSGYEYFSFLSNPLEGIRRFYLAGGIFINRKIFSLRYYIYIPRILFIKIKSVFSNFAKKIKKA